MSLTEFCRVPNERSTVFAMWKKVQRTVLSATTFCWESRSVSVLCTSSSREPRVGTTKAECQTEERHIALLSKALEQRTALTQLEQRISQKKAEADRSSAEQTVWPQISRKL